MQRNFPPEYCNVYSELNFLHCKNEPAWDFQAKLSLRIKKRACRMHGRPEIIQSYKVKIKPEDQQQQVLYQLHFLRIS